MGLKPVHWLGATRAVLQSFPADARRDAGYQLYLVQQGDEPADWKALPSVGAGVREIRVRVRGEYRIVYLATRPEAVYVLHVFSKKTQRTRKLDLDLARARLKELRKRE